MVAHISFDPTHPHPLAALPPKAPIKNADFADLLPKARAALAELKGSCRFHPNPKLLLSPAVMREAVASSRIENINTTIAEALQGELFPEAERRSSDKEVIHYRNALLWGHDQLKRLPISTRLIEGIQHRLMPGRPQGYRKQQNRIANDTSGEVLYTPPSSQDIPRLIGNWENFVNADSDVDPLIRCAIAHYQFEAIHPFDDGNGRTGRILMVLQLVQNELLTLPVLYVSGYINTHRSDYYRLLRGVTADGNWNDYISYILKGFAHQAEETTALLDKIGKLFDEMNEEIRTNHHAVHSTDLILALFTHPIIIPARLAELLCVHYVTATKYLGVLEKAGLLKGQKKGKYHLFFNHRLLEAIGR